MKEKRKEGKAGREAKKARNKEEKYVSKQGGKDGRSCPMT